MKYLKMFAVAAVVLLFVEPAEPCSWATGYFYQVTEVRGKVVGATLGPLQYAGWFRRSFVRKHAELTLYSRRAPIKAQSDMPLVKKLTTDNNGNFDFGSLTHGHYTLLMDDAGWGSSARFDVEVKTVPRETDSVTVDISPNLPDGKGGHKFIVNSK